MTEAQAAKSQMNPFDITKVWPHKDFPLIDVGTIELNRNAQNYFAEVEQAAFTPANVVPGIGFSPDRLLQGRLFSYGDTQRYRLGINHHQIPVNVPQALSRIETPRMFYDKLSGISGVARGLGRRLHRSNHSHGVVMAKKGNAPAVNIGISDKDRKRIAGGLSRLLADTYTLYLRRTTSTGTSRGRCSTRSI